VIASGSMADLITDPGIDRTVRELKAKMPEADHPALESRLHALLNDPDADRGDVIAILRREFDS
jgi:hypothetical protein